MIGLILALAAMTFGLIGTFIPGLPSTPLVLLIAVGHRLFFGTASVSNLGIGLLILLTIFSLGLDYLAGLFGARKMGATWRGLMGAALGGLVGIFFGLPGIILGPFLGAVLFELVGGREFEDATRAGVGALVGLIVGAIGKVACCLAMMAFFAFNVIQRS
jgi:uncharacterized protein YqgC (DUF456 family)